MIFEYFVFSTVYIQHLFSGVHPYHDVAIFVRFPVYTITIIALTINTYKEPDYFPFQPRFGHMYLY